MLDVCEDVPVELSVPLCVVLAEEETELDLVEVAEDDAEVEMVEDTVLVCVVDGEVTSQARNSPNPSVLIN